MARVGEAPCIAVCDWGIGGLDLLHRLMAQRPGARFIYFSDSGATPYGRLNASALAARVGRVVDWLEAQGAEEVFVACNAASTVLPLRPSHRCRVHGVIEPAVQDLLARHGREHLGIIGGARTIRSLAYARPLRAHGVRVHQRVAQPLSAAVEAGLVDAASTRESLARILAPLERAGVTRLVLACTHYIALAAQIRSVWPSVLLYDPVACSVGPAVPVSAGALEGSLARFVTTGSPAEMARGARLAFGYALPVGLPIRGFG